MAQAEPQKPTRLNTKRLAQEILRSIDREREREIIARRFGLFDRRETLEQIGEILGITRERVRQLEKSVVARLKVQAENNELEQIAQIEEALLSYLHDHGTVARVQEVSANVTSENSRTDQSRIAFLAILCPQLTVLEDDDRYYYAIGIKKVRDAATLQQDVTTIVSVIEKIGKPATITEIAKTSNISETAQAASLASISKKLATLNGQWGLVKWPTVNPKNIRDKIYVILKENGKHMHFNDIADSIKKSDFKRKDVTTQAIHNELIKDKRFVLIGRGIYALKEWGYKKGTVADIISQVLREAGEPLHRDEIVKRVLKSRFVKETTILLNLQGKSQFKRVAKATYELDEAENS